MAKLKGTSFRELNELLGDSNKMKVGHNTWAERDTDAINIRLHQTVIVKLFTDKVQFTLGGWNTVTTRERVNQFLPTGNHLNNHRFVAHFNGREISDSEWVEVAA